MIQLAAALMALLFAAYQDPAQAPGDDSSRVREWGERVGDRVKALIPSGGEQLAATMPWDVPFDEPPVWGCQLRCAKYVRLAAHRQFVIDEPALVARVEAAERRAAAAAGRIVAAGSNVSPALAAEQSKVEEEIEMLERSARRVDLEIQLNLPVAERRGQEQPSTSAGMIGGYPAYRFAFVDPSYDPTPRGIRLAVLLGPANFSNPTAAPADALTEIRTIVVSASVMTRADHAKADEALLRKLLDTFDYAELATLLTK